MHSIIVPAKDSGEISANQGARVFWTTLFSLPVPRNKKENDFFKNLMGDCGCLGIIRDQENPYFWIDAYTKKILKFEFWSDSTDFFKPAACMIGDNDGRWKTDDGCNAFCIEPLADVLDIISEAEINVCDYNDCAQGAQCIPGESDQGRDCSDVDNMSW